MPKRTFQPNRRTEPRPTVPDPHEDKGGRSRVEPPACQGTPQDRRQRRLPRLGQSCTGLVFPRGLRGRPAQAAIAKANRSVTEMTRSNPTQAKIEWPSAACASTPTTSACTRPRKHFTKQMSYFFALRPRSARTVLQCAA